MPYQAVALSTRVSNVSTPKTSPEDKLPLIYNFNHIDADARSHLVRRQVDPIGSRAKILLKRAADADEDEAPKSKKPKKKSRTTAGPDQNMTAPPKSTSTTKPPSSTTSDKPSTTTSIKPSASITTHQNGDEGSATESEIMMKIDVAIGMWSQLLKKTERISRYNKPIALKIVYRINDLVRDHWGPKTKSINGSGDYEKRNREFGYLEPERARLNRRINRLDLV